MGMFMLLRLLLNFSPYYRWTGSFVQLNESIVLSFMPINITNPTCTHIIHTKAFTQQTHIVSVSNFNAKFNMKILLHGYRWRKIRATYLFFRSILEDKK